jgi:hypothetical protein
MTMTIRAIMVSTTTLIDLQLRMGPVGIIPGRPHFSFLSPQAALSSVAK